MVRVLKTQSVQSIGYILLRDLITVIFCYGNLGKPLQILKFSRVSFPLHLVSCYIVLSLVMNPHKEKNKDTRCPADICSVRTEAERRQENLVTANNKL